MLSHSEIRSQLIFIGLLVSLVLDKNNSLWISIN